MPSVRNTISAPLFRQSVRALSLFAVGTVCLIGAVAWRSPVATGHVVASATFGRSLLSTGTSDEHTLISPRRAAQAAGNQVVKAELSEWKISITGGNVSPGMTTVEAHNSGTIAHILEIEGNGIEKRTQPIPPDSTVTLSVELKPGKYEIYCPIASGKHKKMGMKSDLDVHSAN